MKNIFFKIKNLLNMPTRFSTMNKDIEIKSFIKDVESYINKEVEKNKNLDPMKAKEIIDNIQKKMKDESKVDIDSLFL